MRPSFICAALALAGVFVMTTSGRAQTPGVRRIPAAEVDATFAKGATLADDPSYKIMTATRTAAGEAELHARDTDIFHVLEGSATFVTGGALIGAHEIGPGETRGAGLEGGVEQTLSAGDVITIDAGVPHWFKAVNGRVRYFVVKVKH